MALPALPPSNTKRFFIDYTSMQIPHTLVVRTNGTGTPAEETVYIQDCVDALASVMRSNDTITGVRVAQLGSNVTFPFIVAPTVGQLSPTAQTWENDPESTQWSIVGRGLSTGRKVRYEFFIPVKFGNWPGNNRWEQGEQATVDQFFFDWQAAINGLTPAPTQAVTIGGDVTVLNQYVNIRSNGYWQNQQRG